ncbi:hypothetical protein K8I28_15125 [bacterium]|nr:hypothetical protein [bacterium]
MRFMSFCIFLLSIILVSSIDAQDSLNVQVTSFHDFPARGVVLSENILYVASYEEGLKLLDVSNPAQPSQIGSCLLEGNAVKVDVNNSIAYVAARAGGLRIISCLDPNDPNEIAFLQFGADVFDVKVHDNLVFIAAAEVGVKIINIEDPQFPTLIGEFDSPGTSRSIIVDGEILYNADLHQGIQILDISDPTQPTELSSLTWGQPAYYLALRDNQLFIANWNAGIRVLNVSEPMNPVQVQLIDTPGSATGVNIHGSFIYACAYSFGLRVIDFSDEQDPDEVGYYFQDGFSVDVAVNNNYSYLADTNHLITLNCSEAINRHRFQIVNPTDTQYLVVIDGAEFDDRDVLSGDAIGVFHGLVCVGAEYFVGEWPLQITCWGGSQVENIPGFILGFPISYRIFSWEHDAEYVAEPEYAIGNGEFGNGQFSLVSLTALEGPVLDIPVYEHDFDIRVLNNAAEAEIVLENTGLEELTITAITTDDNHFTVEPSELNIPSREQATITVTFTPTEAIAYEADIIFESNVPLHPEISFPVRGEGYVLEGLDFSDMDHDFGRVNMNATEYWGFAITNNVGEPVEIGSISSSNLIFLIDHDGFTLEDGEQEIVMVEFSPDDPVHDEGIITVSLVEPVQADFMITVQGTGVEGLEVQLTRNFFNLVSTCLVPEDLSAESVFDIDDLRLSIPIQAVFICRD